MPLVKENASVQLQTGRAWRAPSTCYLELRDRFVAEVPQLTSAEIGARAGLKTKNPYATAARWKKAGDIFSVKHRNKEHFPQANQAPG